MEEAEKCIQDLRRELEELRGRGQPTATPGRSTPGMLRNADICDKVPFVMLAHSTQYSYICEAFGASKSREQAGLFSKEAACGCGRWDLSNKGAVATSSRTPRRADGLASRRDNCGGVRNTIFVIM